MRRLVILLSAGAVVAALLWPGATVRASNEIAKEEGLACTSCHDKPGSKLMTDRGKYYDLMGTFEGYDKVIKTFGKCTTCHVKKPGSMKLTRMGKRYYDLVNNMEGLRDLLEGEHPGSSTAEEEPPPPLPEDGDGQN